MTRIGNLPGLPLLSLLVGLVLVSCSSQTDLPDRAGKTLRLAVPPSGLLAPPVLKMVRDQPLQEHEILFEMVPWNSPDQLRVLMVRGDVDFVGMHLTSASLFHHKGIPTRFLGASLGNVLHVITREPVEEGLPGLMGRTIAIPMRGEYPDIMFRTLLDRLGLSDSIRIQYTATSQDAANQLRAGAVDAALVADPHFSILMNRLGEELGLHHAVDIQAAWNEVNETTSPLVTAGLAAVGTVLQDLNIIELTWKAYQDAVDWCLEHPSEATTLLEARLPDDASREAATRAFASVARHPIPSGIERPLLEQFLGIFRASAPESFGDSIPSDDFFWYPVLAGDTPP